MPTVETLAKPRRRHIRLDALVKAAHRVGKDKEALAWALALANDDSELTPARMSELQVELAVFKGAARLLPLLDSGMPFSPPFFPSEEEATQIRVLFTSLFNSYVTDRQVTITIGRVHCHLQEGHLAMDSPDFINACALELLRLLADFGGSLRRCPEPCGKWFSARKSDSIYCSKTCGSRERMARFRDKEKEKDEEETDNG
jgi:hypothetical protein